MEFGIPYSRILTLTDIQGDISQIEDLVDGEAATARHAGQRRSLSKPQIKRFFQESLASDNIIDLGQHFSAKSAVVLGALKDNVGAKRD